MTGHKSEPEESFRFDGRRITLGNLISVVTMISSMALGYFHLQAKMEVMANDISWIKSTLKNDSHRELHAENRGGENNP